MFIECVCVCVCVCVEHIDVCVYSVIKKLLSYSGKTVPEGVIDHTKITCSCPKISLSVCIMDVILFASLYFTFTLSLCLTV